jgi:predicted metalloendopeptidase
MKEQLFFIAYGRLWCDVGSGEQLYHQMQFTTHAPREVRLAGSIVNSIEFQKIFQCGDRLRQCELW